MHLQNKRGFLCFFVILLVFTFPAMCGKSQRLHITVTGGSNYLAVGDSNRFLRTYNPRGESTSVFKTFNYGSDFSGKVSFSLNRKLGIGLSSGFIQARCSKNPYSTNNSSCNIDIGIQAIPLEAFLEYRMALGKSISLLFQAGPGYYFAAWKKIYRYDNRITSDWYESESSARANGFGGHATVQFRYHVSRNIALVAEWEGRYAPISDFNGNTKWIWSFTPDTSESLPGKLYYFKYKYIYYNTWITEMDIHGRPVGPGVEDLKTATVDFSGTAIRLGLSLSI